MENKTKEEKINLEIENKNKELKEHEELLKNKENEIKSLNEKIQKELVKEHLSPISWDYISPYDINTEWDSEEEMLHYKKLYEMAKKSNKCVFDTFYAYTKT